MGRCGHYEAWSLLPAKWTYFDLYVILDVFSRYVVGWTVEYRENADIAAALIGAGRRPARTALGERRERRRARRHGDRGSLGDFPRKSGAEPRNH